MPQIIAAGVLDAALTGSEIFPFQEAAGGVGSTKHTTLDTITAYINNQIIVAASDSPAQWKKWAGATNTCTGTNDGATINAAVQAVAPVNARKLASIMYAPGTYNISTDAVLMQTGVAHTSFGGPSCTFIKAVNASCRGLVMLRDGNEHFFSFNGFTMHGNGNSGARLGTNTHPNVGNAFWLDHRAGNDATFVGVGNDSGEASPPASGFQSTNWSGKVGLFTAAGGCATDWNGTNNTTTASLYDTGSTAFSEITNIRGGKFLGGQYSPAGNGTGMTNFDRRFFYLRREGASHLPASNGYQIHDWNLTSCCDGTALEITNCADGTLSNVHIGGGSYGMLFNCGEWRVSDFKLYFQTIAGLDIEGGFNVFVNGVIEDVSGATDGTGVIVNGQQTNMSNISSNSNKTGFNIMVDRIQMSACSAFNRGPTSGFSGVGTPGQTQTVGVQIANNRNALDIDVNCTDPQAITSTTPQNPLVLVGSVPTGRVRIVNGSQVISFGDEFAQYLKPTGSYETYPRMSGIADRAALSTGRVSLQALRLPAGFKVTNLVFATTSAGTPAGTPTHWWFSLCDNAYTTLRSTADQLTTAWAANTVMSKALSSTFTTTYEGLYYLAIMMTATTVVTLAGQAVNSTVSGITPLVCLTGITGQTTAPADGTNLATSPAAAAFGLYAYVT